MAPPGGRIPPDGRPAQVPGVGKRSKRHDLERRNTPFLHDSDLQQGDVQALEQGQRIAPKQTQGPAAPVQGSGTTVQPDATGAGQSSGLAAPDPIEFIAGRSSGAVGIPQPRVGGPSRAAEWLPILRQLATGPGSSGLLASALINQVRQMRQSFVPVTVIDFQDIDAGLEAMLDEGI